MTLNCQVIFCGSHEVGRCIICVVLVFLEKNIRKEECDRHPQLDVWSLLYNCMSLSDLSSYPVVGELRPIVQECDCSIEQTVIGFCVMSY